MNSARPGVVITGGDFQGLAVLRTFGEKNIPIALVDYDHCIAKYSRYKKRCFRSPNPEDEDAYAEFLVNLAKREGLEGWIVIPNSDQIVRVISRNKALLEGFYKIPVPHWDVIQYVYIKENTYKIAHQHGIPVPGTYYAGSLEEMVAHDLPYPVVIKPSIRDNFYSKVKIKAFLVNNEDELVATYKKVSTVIEPAEILVQEYIAGGPKNLYSFCPFFKDGRVIAAIMARRARQHPMDFGHATTYAELVDIPQLRSLAERFLSLIGYYGVAEVEFMQDPRDGSFRLIEVNPRVWGWHALAIYAGVDLPYMLYKDMLGESIESPCALKDVKWIRLITDIPTVAVEIMQGRMTIREYLKTMKGRTRDAVFSINDPLPFIAELVMVPYLWYKRGF
jgi:predicted ATP-grasp superfamily ATP-dependent carboligase